MARGAVSETKQALLACAGVLGGLSVTRPTRTSGCPFFVPRGLASLWWSEVHRLCHGANQQRPARKREDSIEPNADSRGVRVREAAPRGCASLGANSLSTSIVCLTPSLSAHTPPSRLLSACHACPARPPPVLAPNHLASSSPRHGRYVLPSHASSPGPSSPLSPFPSSSRGKKTRWLIGPAPSRHVLFQPFTRSSPALSIRSVATILFPLRTPLSARRETDGASVLFPLPSCRASLDPPHQPIPDHLPTLVVTPHGQPTHVLYSYLHTDYVSLCRTIPQTCCPAQGRLPAKREVARSGPPLFLRQVQALSPRPEPSQSWLRRASSLLRPTRTGPRAGRPGRPGIHI